MSKLSEEEEKIARAALEENYILRQMLQETANGGCDDEEVSGTSVDKVDSIFALRRGNEILKGEIADLQSQIDASGVSAAETVHKFNQLQNKRAQLRNENRGLENIANHQAPKVKEVNRLVLNQLTMKRSCDEKNRVSKEEIKRLKDIREKEMEKLYVTLRKEAYLKEQLENANLASNSSDSQTLRNAILSKDKTIQKLEEDIERARTNQRKLSDDENGYSEDGLEKLRKEHDGLREQVQTLQALLQGSPQR
ncbi:hypothetical protein C3747_73g8 [Trypanosoma cruzi]|uniref:Uncharacterized protein n=3 Tax=Trypanosoma cruzi TaxID=5693 RepID=Q4CPK1_TRYCC|nr:hypothetical protein, conserved [Trypanosoma cruzi]EAN82204.1 hypothetical protein, conserved [Trypanosoma cruzi]KAF8297664.1 hypothetical protein TcYC6_0080150 [Trypanosoma cruzi]PWV09945.1 hypothetical protein C3747_73g8 [Trypanosoma cruzi]|eukprot:XP_804055.1 hypothetical protein [Trypanosoma cruzi strain CL Brener]